MTAERRSQRQGQRPDRDPPFHAVPRVLLGDQAHAALSFGDVEYDVGRAELLPNLPPLALQTFQKALQPVTAHVLSAGLLGGDVPLEEVPIRIGRDGAPLPLYGGGPARVGASEGPPEPLRRPPGSARRAPGGGRTPFPPAGAPIARPGRKNGPGGSRTGSARPTDMESEAFSRRSISSMCLRPSTGGFDADPYRKASHSAVSLRMDCSRTWSSRSKPASLNEFPASSPGSAPSPIVKEP